MVVNVHLEFGTDGGIEAAHLHQYIPASPPFALYVYGGGNGYENSNSKM